MLLFKKHYNKRFVVLLLLITVLSLLSSLVAVIVFYPRYQNISVFDELSLSIQNVAKDNTKLAKKIATLREEKELLTQNQITKKDQDTLSWLEGLIGVKKITGEGVIIILDNQISHSQYDTALLCHGANIRDILNILKLPQLEVRGVSINGVRVHIQSGINCFADGIAVGTTRLFAPYEIQAIGLSRQIINTLQTKTLAPELWKQIDTHQITLTIEERDDLSLPSSSSTPSTHFIEEYVEVDA